ncbi:MAG: GntR family transcriptional regulator, partial [Verrucomicrobiae bacterium]|nr:GntR family transcriptional regulator [Verrucomicrobiae bacterium]
SDRLIATSKLGRYLDKTPPKYAKGEAVSLIILEKTPLGYAAVVEGSHRGLIHASEVHRPLASGDEMTGYIRSVKDDYKIDLALEPVGFGRVTDLSDRILEALRSGGGRLDLGDASSPEEIKERFGSSKKAFKQAIGTLYRKKLIIPGPHSLELSSSSRG